MAENKYAQALENEGVAPGGFSNARALSEGVGLGERKIEVIAARAQGDSNVPSLNGKGMIEDRGTVVKFEVFMRRSFCVRSN